MIKLLLNYYRSKTETTDRYCEFNECIHLHFILRPLTYLMGMVFKCKWHLNEPTH